MKHTYRATMTLELEIVSNRERSAFDLEQIAGGIVGVGQAQVRERSIEITEAYCTALARRNSIDGHLYQCSMVAGNAIHGSVAACGEAMGHPCDKPEEHHTFASPGWEAPVERVAAAVPS